MRLLPTAAILIALPLSFLTRPTTPAAHAPEPAPARDDERCDALLRDFATCAANTDRDRRLEAYDALARACGLSPVKHGSWSVTATTNAIDDTKTVVLGLGAEKEVAKPSGGSFQPQLVLRCKAGKIDVYTITGIPTDELPDHRAATTLRFGKEKPVEVRMDRSTESDALFWPDAAANAEKLLHAGRLVFQFSPKGYEPVVLEFDLRGIEEVYPQLAAACAKAK